MEKIAADRRLNKALIISLILFGLFPILPSNVKGLPVAVLLLLGLVFLIKGYSKLKIDTRFLVLTSLLSVNLLSVLYSGSMSLPWKKLETSISFYIIPLAFFLLQSEKVKIFIRRREFYYSFIVSTLLLSFISFWEYFKKGFFFDSELRVNSFRKAITELPYIGDHPIYISIFLGLSILFSLFCFSQSNKAEKLVLIVNSFISIFHLLLLSSKGVVIALFVTILFYVYRTFQKLLVKTTLSALLLILFIIALLKFPNLERRFREITIKTTYTELRLENSSSIRLAVYECSMLKIAEKPIFGVGWGKGNEALKDCYKNKSDHLFKEDLNTHNQYLGCQLEGGLPLLAMLIFFIFFFFKWAWARNDLNMSSTVVFFTIVMATENILVRQSGVILFVFMFAFFCYSTALKKASK